MALCALQKLQMNFSLHVHQPEMTSYNAFTDRYNMKTMLTRNRGVQNHDPVDKSDSSKVKKPIKGILSLSHLRHGSITLHSG
jgi:hypothetical protein